MDRTFGLSIERQDGCVVSRSITRAGTFLPGANRHAVTSPILASRSFGGGEVPRLSLTCHTSRLTIADTQWRRSDDSHFLERNRGYASRRSAAKARSPDGDQNDPDLPRDHGSRALLC